MRYANAQRHRDRRWSRGARPRRARRCQQRRRRRRPSKGVVIKGKAPVSDEVLRVKLPRPQEADLPNGLHLMVLEDRRVPQITMQLLDSRRRRLLRPGRPARARQRSPPR